VYLSVGHILGAFAELRKATASSRLSAWNN